MYSKTCWLLVIMTWFWLTDASGQPYGLTNRPDLATFLNNVLPEAVPLVSGNWTAIPAFPNLYFTNIIGVLPIPGTTQLVAWEREGRMWSFENDSNTTQKTLMLDIHNQCQGWGDSGLLGIAFHPGFATNHFLFVYYTWVVPGTVVGDPNTPPPTIVFGGYHDRLSRFTLDNNAVAIPNSEVVFVDQVGDNDWHNGGGIFFHPGNGFLYWTDGDDANNLNTQIINRDLLSGLFRIDVDMRGGNISHPPPRQPQRGTTAHYYIPNDNPFVGQANVLEEFFCLGLRSPHRMTFDEPTGRIFIGDVGEGAREEIDILAPGEMGQNFQWDRIEGLQGDLTPPYIGVNHRPALDYSHSEGTAVIGGYVYHGNEFAADLGGKYIFGDNGSRTLWVMDESTVPAGKVALCSVPAGDGPNSGHDYIGLSSFGLDADGEIYMCQMSSIGGRIYKLARTGAAAASRPLPTLLSQTGAFTNLTTLTPVPGLVPYSVNTPLWSDGAVKQRWMALPTNTFINFAPTGEWTFPKGTVFMKHFELPVNETNPALTKRLETRLLVCDTNGTFYGASYKWRDDYSDADLVVTATNKDFVVTTATGTRTQTWTYPGQQDCLRCHTIPAKGVLGVKTRQLNGNFTYPANGVTDNQLRAWNHAGLFTPAISEAAIPGYTKLAPLSDTNATVEFRARSYLDANCSQCHRPSGVLALFDARIDTPLTNQGLLDGPVINSLNITGARVISPGNTNRSVLFQRDNSLGSIQMPPLAKNVIDTNAMALLSAWITSLPPVNTLPSPWTHTDIGNVGFTGDDTYQSGQFSMDASGDDIGNSADAFHLIYQPFNGDGEIRARVLSISNGDPSAKAGVMFRETLAAGAKHAFMAVSYANGSAFVRRTVTDGASASTFGTNITAPGWVRLVRAGNVFTGYTSTNGFTWKLVDSVTNSMNSQVYIGLAATAHNNSALNAFAFDHVTIVSPVTVAAAAIPSTNPLTPLLAQFTALPGGGFAALAPFDTTDDHRGIVTAQGEFTNNNQYAVDAFDNSTATKWLDFATNSNPFTHASWIQYQYTTGRQCAVTQYTIASADDEPERDPKNWQLLGSNNGGANWTVLDVRTNQTFTNRFQVQAYSLINAAAYNVYRLQIDSVYNPPTANAVQLSEIEFIGLPVYTCLWSFGDGATSTAQNPAHTYATSGTYVASVIVSDGSTTATNTAPVTVGLGGSQPLTVLATATPPSGDAPLLVQFAAQAAGGLNLTTPFSTTDDHQGTITAQGEFAANGQYAANAFDNSTATKWLDFATNSNPFTHASWIQYQYPGGHKYVVTQYTIASADDEPARDPMNWQLLGSNDGGTNWTVLDVRTNQSFPSRFQVEAFSSTNTAAYNLYRLQIDSVSNPAAANAVQLSEIEFIGLPAYSYLWSFGDGVISTAQNPLHTYLTNGIYSVVVIASDGTTTATNSLTLTLRPTLFWLPSGTYLTGGVFHLLLYGSTGVTYVVDATTNLKTWTPVFTNTTTNGMLEFVEPKATNFPFRFYRARE